MGCDVSSDDSFYYPEEINQYRYHRHNVNRQQLPDSIFPQSEPYLQSKVDPYFNFPEVKEEKYSGSGIKKMKGYISNISQEELLKKRAEFWETRVEGNKEIWSFLQRICDEPEFKEQDVTPYLKAMDIVPYSNCINVTYDSLGNLYEIPNYCINMPYKYDLPEDATKKPGHNKEIIVTVRKGGDIKSFQMSVMKNGKQVKKFLAKNFEGVTLEKIRLFYSGKEIENNKELWQYNIQDKANILMMVSN